MLFPSPHEDRSLSFASSPTIQSRVGPFQSLRIPPVGHFLFSLNEKQDVVSMLRSSRQNSSNHAEQTEFSATSFAFESNPSLVRIEVLSSLPPTHDANLAFRMLSTRIPSTDDPSYRPLVTISDNEHSDSEENFISPIHKLTKTELREELNAFNANAGPKRHGSNYALLAHGDDDDDDDDDDEGTTDIQFRTHEAIKRSVCCHSYLVTLKDNLCTIS